MVLAHLERVQNASALGGRKNLCNSRLARQELRQSDADAGAAVGVCGRTARGFCPDRGWMGKNGNDARSARRSNRGCAGGSSAHGMEAKEGEDTEGHFPSCQSGDSSERRLSSVPGE